MLCASVAATAAGRVLPAGAARTLRRLNSTVAELSAAPAVSLWDEARPYSEIPGPTPLPIVGNRWRFLPGIGDLANMDALRQLKYLHDKYGPIVKQRGLGRPDFVTVTDADAAELVHRNEGPWPIREGAFGAMDYYLRKIRNDNRIGVITSQGKEWQEFRSAVNQVMMQPRSARMYTGPINAVAQDFVDRMWAIRDSKGEMPEDFYNEICKFTLETIFYITLDTRMGTLADNLHPDSEAQRMIETARTIFEDVYNLDLTPSPWEYISTPTFRRFVKSMDFFHEAAEKHVANAMDRLKALPKAELGERDFSVLERLLINTGDPHQAVTMAIDMLMAGVDTSASLLAVTMELLTKYPEKQKALQEELDRVIPDPSQPITQEQLQQLKYLRAVIREASRYKPVFTFVGRTTVKDMVILGYQIPKGTRMGMPCLMGTDEKYVPRAKEFLPERWLPEGSSLKPKHPFAHLSFGFGSRMCIGMRFANLEMEILLAKLFRRYELEWHYPPPVSAVKFILGYTSPLKFTVKKRV